MQNNNRPQLKIYGTGHYVPERILSNFDLEKMVDTSDEWITERSGIKERRIVAPEQASSDLAVEACKIAMEDAGVSPDEIGGVICATITPDMHVPSTACIVQDALGIPITALAFDCNAACTGFLYALTIADGMIASGFQDKKLLVFSAEAISRMVDYEDRGSCILFGDGCGAAVVGASDDDKSRILYTKLGSDGSLADMITVPAGGSRKPCSHETVDARESYIKVAGRIVFKTAVRTMSEEPELAVKTLGITMDDIKLLIPHQANIRIIEAGANKLNFPMDRVFVNIHKYGNTSGATIPIGLDESIREGKIERGDLFMMISFGAGYTYGTMVLQY